MRNYLILILTFFIWGSSCTNAPKVIDNNESASDETSSTGIFSTEKSSNSASLNESGMHQVVVEEILPTSKYIYLYVKEGEDKFWIATGKQSLQVGQTIYYNGGLLKTNFESKEHNRIFDKIYLVSRIVTSDHANEAGSSRKNHTSDNSDTDGISAPIEVEGSIKIASIVNDPEKYEGQTIQISGKCVKVNYNIMGKNWIHIKDGSQDDYDLVITSSQQIPEGHTITMAGKVVLKKDFGAGYYYDLIIEDGEIVK